MLNVHFNADLVRCPDIRAILLRQAEERMQQCRCKYGIQESYCKSWIDYCNNSKEIKPISAFGRCWLSGCDKCPNHKTRQSIGNIKKTFSIDAKHYRQISSSAHYLLKTSIYKTLFITLTFPPFKKYCNDKQINQLFRKYVENLRKNYNCSGYIGVRENGTQHGRVHFHLLISIPYIEFYRLNNIWCHTISNYCSFSKNAVQTDPKARFITDPIRAVKYVCKYFSKCRGQKSETRLIFISNNINIKHKTFDGKTNNFFTLNDLFDRYKSISVYGSSEYTTLFRINDPQEFKQFCSEYLYKLFEIPEKNTSFYTYSSVKT